MNWGDDDFSSEEEQSEKKKKENSEAAREKIQTASTVTDSIVPPATRSEISVAPSSKRQPVPPASTRSSTSGKSKTSIDLNPMASDDDSWTLVGARKPGPKRSVLYIGNLNAECTEEKLMAFVEGRAKTIGNAAPKVFNAKIYTTKSESGCLSARLTVAESDRALLQARNFWPRPIYARPWNFHLASSKEGESRDISVVKVLKTSTCKDNDDKDGPSLSSLSLHVLVFKTFTTEISLDSPSFEDARWKFHGSAPGAEPQPKCESDDALGQDHV